MDFVLPTVDQVRQLPSSFRVVVSSESADGNGHLNMAKYLSLHDAALWEYNAGLGFDRQRRDVARRGLFTLEQHLAYHAEVLVGDLVTVRCRVLERTSKLMHGVSFIVNETNTELSNTMEFVTAYVDLEHRRVVQFDTEVAAVVDRELASHRALGWDAAISRAMTVGPQKRNPSRDQVLRTQASKEYP